MDATRPPRAGAGAAPALQLTVPVRLCAGLRSPDANGGHCRRPSFVGTTVTSMSSNLPFGFGSGDRDPSQPDDLSSKIPLFAELQKLMSWSGGPVNWDLARQIAISSVANANQTPTAEQLRQVVESIRLADLWLDDVTDLPS